MNRHQYSNLCSIEQLTNDINRKEKQLLLNNLVASTDAYKGGHFFMYPKNSFGSKVYICPRKEMSGTFGDGWILFGVSYFISKYLTKPITHEMIDVAKKYVWDKFYIGGQQYPFPENGWRKIVDKYNGYLPITITGIPEGLPYDKYNVPAVIIEVCPDPDLVWLAGWLEAAFQRVVWSASTVATKSRMVRKYLHRLFEKSVDSENMWKLNYRLHDFGGRGTVVEESAGLLGLAHLINFDGTDTNDALVYGYVFYDKTVDQLACSVIATEHSVTTAHGNSIDGERDLLYQVVNTLSSDYPHIKVFSYVSDSFNYKQFIDEVWCDPKVIEYIRSKGLSPVVRPDSGDPNTNVLYALDKLSKAWGYTVNSKGYKVLSNIAIIQGDGMRVDTIKYLYDDVLKAGFSPENLVIGMGGGLLQDMTRDTMSWNMKLFELTVDGTVQYPMKNPITQQSKKAWSALDGYDSHLFIPYYHMGLINPDAFNFDSIRTNARKGLV